MSAIDCIITATELSSKMEQRKMTLPWQQGTILDTSIESVLRFYSQIISVTGYHGSELYERYVNQNNITIIHNPDYMQGLLASIKATVPAVQAEHCFLTHGDMPTLAIDIFRRVWSLRNDGAILPPHNGIPGHPILVSKPCLIQAIQRPNVTNMRQALLMGARYPVEIENAEIILDIDTSDDFITTQKRHARIQKMQLSDRVQVFNLSSTLYHNDKESLILRKEKG